MKIWSKSRLKNVGAFVSCTALLALFTNAVPTVTEEEVLADALTATLILEDFTDSDRVALAVGSKYDLAVAANHSVSRLYLKVEGQNKFEHQDQIPIPNYDGGIQGIGVSIQRKDSYVVAVMGAENDVYVVPIIRAGTEAENQLIFGNWNAVGQLPAGAKVDNARKITVREESPIIRVVSVPLVGRDPIFIPIKDEVSEGRRRAIQFIVDTALDDQVQ